MRRLIIVVALIVLFGQINIASAREILQGDTCTVAADTTITGDVFVACQQLIIDGTITGNLFGAALSGRISGTVGNSAYLLMWQLEISGSIDGDLHFGGGAVHITPSATLTGDVISASLSTRLEDVAVPGGVTSIGYQLLQDGSVGGEISFWGTALAIDGHIGGNVSASVGDRDSIGANNLSTLFNVLFRIDLITPGLRVTEDASIDGVLNYSSVSEGEIAGQLANPPEYIPVIVALDLDNQTDITQSVNLYFARVLRELIALLLIGVIALFVVPAQLQDPIYSIRTRPLPSLGVGLITFILSFAIIFAITALGIGVVLLFAAVNLPDIAIATGVFAGVITLGGAGAYFFVAIYISRVIVCLAMGRLILRAFLGDRLAGRWNYVALLIGVVILAFLTSLPLIGDVFNALALFLGLGAILTLVQRELDQVRHPATARAPGTGTLRIPPPILEDLPSGPGMENLPDGFKWWN